MKRKLLLAGGAIAYVWIASVLYTRQVKSRKGYVRPGVGA